jgi:SAM-dependent methyltransferase
VIEGNESISPFIGGNAGQDYGELVARWWSDQSWDRERRTVEEHFIERWLSRFIGEPSMSEVLDAACGTGLHAFVAAECGYTVTACDASWHQVERAKLIARRHRLQSPEVAANPFFRTLKWIDLQRHYDQKFRGLLCLGGSLIHASAAELPTVALSVVATLRRPGFILIDHREAKFFANPENCWATHPGHRREVEFNAQSFKVRFKMTDNRGEVMVIEGRLHPVQEIIDVFAQAGAVLVDRSNDYQFEANHENPEWHHLTFRVG